MQRTIAPVYRFSMGALLELSQTRHRVRSARSRALAKERPYVVEVNPRLLEVGRDDNALTALDHERPVNRHRADARDQRSFAIPASNAQGGIHHAVSEPAASDRRCHGSTRTS